MPFEQRKKAILDQLNTPDNEYTDLSPKGSIDSGIRDLIEELNKIPGLVTTSSCAGRVSVFLEGKKKPAPTPESTVDDEDGEERAIATPGGKGGGRWLFVSHDPLRPPSGLEDGRADKLHSRFKLHPGNRSGKDIPPGASFIHFKFEPMILHFLTASLRDANAVLAAATQAGFRESGAMNLAKSDDGILNPMVAVRSMGLAFDSIIGYQDSDGVAVSFVDETYLARLVQVGNERFETNSERIGRFRSYLLKEYSPNAENRSWEDAAERRQRKRLEGLAKQHERKKQIVSGASDILDDYEVDPGTFVV